jgi:uncharacterized protein
MKKRLLITVIVLAGLFTVACIFLYAVQEKLIFHPTKLEKSYAFEFDGTFEEKYIPVTDGTVLHGVLFQADSTKGLIFYLHGNGGAVHSWGSVAKTYTDLNYDVFIIDYRGYGKSEGSIRSETQLAEDLQTVYDELKKRYAENTIVVLGYSIGTGPAAKLASVNHPKLLILQAPYYSLTNMMRSLFPVVPTFLLNYKFQTNEHLKACTMPVIIFHGDQDEVIPYSSAVKLKEEVGTVNLITLPGQTHNGMTDNPDYRAALNTIL